MNVTKLLSISNGSYLKIFNGRIIYNQCWNLKIKSTIDVLEWDDRRNLKEGRLDGVLQQ